MQINDPAQFRKPPVQRELADRIIQEVAAAPTRADAVQFVFDFSDVAEAELAKLQDLLAELPT